MPFRPTGPITPLTDVAMKRSASSQSAFPNRSIPSPSAQGLPRIQENDALPGVGVDPADWIAAHPYDSSSYLAFWNHYPSLNEIPLPNASNCPSLYTGHSVREQLSPMTPQTSSFGYSNNADPNWSYNGTNMANASLSQSSFASQQLSRDMFTSEENGYTHGRGDVGIDLLACGAGAELQDFERHGDLPHNLENSLTVPSESASMARSSSNMSTASCRSTASSQRLKERREQVLENSRITLAPKPQENLLGSTAASTKPLKRGKVVSRKTASQRRKCARVFCTHCEEHTAGFRGVHELQRHLNSKHSPTVNKWLCRDPASMGINTVRPKIPLEGCKKCESGKHYGAYYNAAAHLRRAHFKPKEVRANSKSLRTEEKRGGSAGGDWPPMDVLKDWLKEVVVTGQPVKVEEAFDPDQIDDEDYEMDEADDNSEASFEAEVETEIVLHSSPMMLDASHSTSTGEVLPVQAPNTAVSDNSYETLRGFSLISNTSDILHFGAGLAPTLSMDPAFTSVSPSDWNSVSSGTYISTYDYTNQGDLPGIF